MSHPKNLRLDADLERQLDAALAREKQAVGEVNRAAVLRRALRIGLAQLHENTTAPRI